LRENLGGKLSEMLRSYLIGLCLSRRFLLIHGLSYPSNNEDYVHITTGTRYNELLSNYGVDRLLIDTELQQNYPSFKKILPELRV
jgi:hypothetical protein